MGSSANRYLKDINYITRLLPLPIVVFDRNFKVYYSNYPELSSTYFMNYMHRAISIFDTIPNPHNMPIIKHNNFDYFNSIIPLNSDLFIHVGPSLRPGASFSGSGVFFKNALFSWANSLFLLFAIKNTTPFFWIV